MANYFTSNTLISAVKRKGSIPSNQITFSDDDFLAFANEELKIGLIPSILQLHEEYYVWPEIITLVANTSKYEIPYRAIGGRLRDVFYQDSNGNLVEMSRIKAEDKALYQASNIQSSYIFYYMEANNIVLTPEVNSTPTGSIVVTYYLRPNELVSEDRVGIIENIAEDGTFTTYTVDSIPTGFSTSTKTDLLQAKPGHKTRNFDIIPTSISTTNKTITFLSTDVDSNTEEGDHIAFAGECIIPQVPTDLHPVLAQRVVARCLEALGDTQGLQNANTKLQEMEMKTVSIIDNRVEGAPIKISNPRGLLNNSRLRRRRWF